MAFLSFAIRAALSAWSTPSRGLGVEGVGTGIILVVGTTRAGASAGVQETPSVSEGRDVGALAETRVFHARPVVFVRALIVVRPARVPFRASAPEGAEACARPP